jgi:hypothetical protein
MSLLARSCCGWGAARSNRRGSLQFVAKNNLNKIRRLIEIEVLESSASTQLYKDSTE